MIKEPIVPEIAEYYVIAHLTRGYLKQSVYRRLEFTKELKNAQLYSSLYHAQAALTVYKEFLSAIKIKKLIMCVD